MKVVTVRAERDYEVVIGAGWLAELESILTRHRQVLVLIPSQIANLPSLSQLRGYVEESHLLLLPEGEGQKDSRTLETIWNKLGDLKFSRSDAVVAIGGGATTDVSGFAAASWLRGISWYAFPTTLAGMVDAAVGGKTGINTSAGKNLVGAFHSPAKVVVDPTFLETLPDRDFAAGLAEVIKTGFIADEAIVNLLDAAPDIQSARTIGAELISRSVTVKASVVSQDFKEGKLREILNYGHTLGHAIEKFENYRLRHGEAVAIGMVFAAELSKDLCGLSDEIVDMHRNLLLKFGLPVSFPRPAFTELLRLMESDKKSRAGQLRFIGISSVGHPEWFESVEPAQIESAYGRIAI